MVISESNGVDGANVDAQSDEPTFAVGRAYLES
jgi:hypothetical protein